MKISLIGPVFPYRGGIAHFTTLLAKKLKEAGHEVQVISFKKQYPAWLYPGKSDKDTSPEREKVDAEYLIAPLAPLSWHRTIKAITDFHPDQIIISWWVTFWGLAFQHIMAHLKMLKFSITTLIHNTIPHETRPWDRYLARRTLKFSDRYIVMTEKEKGRLLKLLPEAKDIQIAPLPIFNAFKPSVLTQPEARHSLGLPPDKPVLLHFGLIRPYKGLGVLIDALKIMVDRGETVLLLIVGEFWEDKTNYLSQIKALGLEGHVKIYDSYIPDDEIAPFFKAADLFVAPYVGGTQSGSLKASLGFGLPAVVTDIMADELILNLPELCRVVPSGNPEKLAEAINLQISTPRLEECEIKVLLIRSWDAMIVAIEKQT